MWDGAPQGHLLAALCERGDVGIAPYEMTCRAGPMCPAAKDTFSPAGHAAPPYRARESWADRVVRPYRRDGGGNIPYGGAAC